MKNMMNLSAVAVFLFGILFGSQAQATWMMTHGTSGHVEAGGAGGSVKADGLVVQPAWAPSTWVHFAVPTNGAITAGAQYVRLIFTESSLNSQISRVDIYNGNVLVNSFTGLNWGSDGLITKYLNLGSVKHFPLGMGVSVEITAGPDSGTDTFTFHGVGAYFVP